MPAGLRIRGGHAAALLLLAGCTLLGQPQSPEAAIRRKVNQLQVNLERHIPGEEAVKLALLGLVDTAAAPKAAAAADADPEAVAAGVRRERVMRQELGALLVKNRLLELVQPTEAQIQQARTAVEAANSPALDKALAAQLGHELGVEYIVGALSDSGGRVVSLVAQDVSDGVLLFQDTLLDWPALLPLEAAVE